MAEFLLSAFADEASPMIEGQIVALKRNGVKFIEVRNANGKSIIDHDKNSLKEIKKQFDAGGISVSSIGSPIGKIAVNQGFEPHIEAFKRTIETAQILETNRIRMFSFFIPHGADPASFRLEVMERMNSLLDIADGTGVMCCHENEKDIYGDIKERTLDLHKTLGSRLKGIFDPANYIQCKEVPALIFDELFPYIDYMHIKDALLCDGAVVPSGCGDSNMAVLLKKFSKADGKRFLSVEPHLSVFEGLKNLQDDSLKHKFTYASNDEAFDVAVKAIKRMLEEEGYIYG